jgi:hypothetical protein
MVPRNTPLPENGKVGSQSEPVPNIASELNLVGTSGKQGKNDENAVSGIRVTDSLNVLHY